jgi:hypothetical protein
MAAGRSWVALTPTPARVNMARSSFVDIAFCRLVGGSKFWKAFRRELIEDRMCGVPGMCRGLSRKLPRIADARLLAVWRRVPETIGIARDPVSLPSVSQAAVRLRLMKALPRSSCSMRDRVERRGSRACPTEAQNPTHLLQVRSWLSLLPSSRPSNMMQRFAALELSRIILRWAAVRFRSSPESARVQVRGNVRLVRRRQGCRRLEGGVSLCQIPRRRASPRRG